MENGRSGTYVCMCTNPPQCGYGSPAPYVAATVNRAIFILCTYNKKSEESTKYLNGYKNFRCSETWIKNQ